MMTAASQGFRDTTHTRFIFLLEAVIRFERKNKKREVIILTQELYFYWISTFIISV